MSAMRSEWLLETKTSSQQEQQSSDVRASLSDDLLSVSITGGRSTSANNGALSIGFA